MILIIMTSALTCIESGQHIFVEKPVCLYLEEAKSIINCLRDNPKVRFSSNLILRKSSRFADLKQRIDINELGEFIPLMQITTTVGLRN